MQLIMEYKYGSPEYHQACCLRNEVLRVPLGMSLYDEDLSSEADQIHIGVFEGGICLGTLSLLPLGESVCRIRQVAVAPQYQRKGIGRQMMEYAEKYCMQKGYGKLMLHARADAIPFYLKLDYRIIGEPFLEVTILHCLMEKRL